MVNDGTRVNAPQHGEERTFVGRVLQTKRLGPLDQIVRKGTRPERSGGQVNAVRMDERLRACFCLKLHKEVPQIPGTKGHAVVPRPVFPFFHLRLQQGVRVNQLNVARKRFVHRSGR